MAQTSIWERKLDLVYLVFFATHVVIMLLVDLYPLYPASFRPAFLDQIRHFYIDQYQDKFFVDPPGWFRGYMFMEAVYHLPLSIWAVGGFLRDHPLIPVHILIWAVQTVMTTLTCLFEVWDWDDRTKEQKYNISLLYFPYAVLAALMGVDMFYRLQKQVVKPKKD